MTRDEVLNNIRVYWLTNTGSAPNFVHFNEVDNGDRFAASEQPKLFARQIRAAFTSLPEQGR